MSKKLHTTTSKSGADKPSNATASTLKGDGAGQTANGFGASAGNGGSHSHSPFTHPVPEGAAKTVAAVLGEITWLMSQSKAHKQFFIADLEWLVMTPILLNHFRIFYDTGVPAEAGKPAVEGKPIGVVLWASVNDEVAARLAEGGGRMGPQDWTSGDQLWIVEVIAPFGGHDAMVADLKERVFSGREIRALVLGVDGTRKVGVV
jgi:cytolysin-activating lysine-acyltransferase